MELHVKYSIHPDIANVMYRDVSRVENECAAATDAFRSAIEQKTPLDDTELSDLITNLENAVIEASTLLMTIPTRVEMAYVQKIDPSGIPLLDENPTSS